MPTINDLPTELVLVVFGYMDLKTMITASSICRRWYELCKLPEQQYRVAQSRYSVVDGPPNDEWPASRRLEALQAFQARWHAISPSKRHRFEHVPLAGRWECSSGVCGGAGQNWITFKKSPSITTGGSEESWTINVPITIRDFCMDSYQDLVVVVDADRQRARRDLHFLSMRNGTPHPRANYSMISEDIVSVWPYDSGCSIEIYGECVAILFRGTTPPGSQIRNPTSALIVWNWRTGDKLAHVRSNENDLIDSFCFLSPDHVTVGRRAGLSAVTSSCLEVYDFGSGLQHVTMRRFQLPRKQPDIRIAKFEILCEATPRPTSEAWRPFYTSPANRICMITAYYRGPRLAQHVNYIVFASNLLGLFPNEDLHPETIEVDGFRHISTVPWKEWNRHTCVTLWESDRRVYKVVTCGTRVVRLISAGSRGWSPSRVQICDFNPYIRHRAQNKPSSKGHETTGEETRITEEVFDVDHAGCVDRVLVNDGEENEDDVLSTLVTFTRKNVDPHPLPIDSVFEEPVLSALPYVKTTTVEAFGANYVMMDFENIYLLSENDVQVLSF